MNYKVSVLVLILCSYVAGCSTTPGDAAYRGGHSEQAANLYKQGVDNSDGSAALKLGLMVSNSEAPTSEYGNAVKWYLRACELGNNAGCHNSGNAYEYGKDGANKEYTKAREYYLLAAERGYMQSQYNLGSLYSNQHYNNDIEGLKWMLVARNTAEQCSNNQLCNWVLRDPPGHISKLEGRMSKEQITQSKQQATQWIAKQ